MTEKSSVTIPEKQLIKFPIWPVISEKLKEYPISSAFILHTRVDVTKWKKNIDTISHNFKRKSFSPYVLRIEQLLSELRDEIVNYLGQSVKVSIGPSRIDLIGSIIEIVLLLY